MNRSDLTIHQMDLLLSMMTLEVTKHRCHWATTDQIARTQYGDHPASSKIGQGRRASVRRMLTAFEEAGVVSHDIPTWASKEPGYDNKVWQITDAGMDMLHGITRDL